MATTSESGSSVRREAMATMAILRWPPISPQPALERKSGSACSSSAALRIPGMGLRLRVACPCVQGIIDHEAVPEHDVVVHEQLGEAQRDREQSRCLWGELQVVGVRAP